MYASVQDLRDEGIATGTEARLATLLAEATAIIDRVTGWFFEPRQRTYRLDGRGTRSLEPPVPPIRIDRVTVDGADVDVRALLVEGSPVEPGFVAPRIALPWGGLFSRGIGNIEVTGLWGYTEPDGTPNGRTPLAIRRAAMLLVMRMLTPLGTTGGAGAGAPSGWRVVEERTRDQMVKYGPIAGAVAHAPRMADAEPEEILLGYRRPAPLGAA